jgi:hypothetical protein
VKLALLKLQHEEFMQSIAELCGQPRKPQIPKEAPTAVRDELKLKIRVRLSSRRRRWRWWWWWCLGDFLK